MVFRRGVSVHPISYKGFAITPRTFQIRGSGRWTLDLLITRRRSSRAFSGPDTYATESAAIVGDVRVFGRIDYLEVWNEERFLKKLQREPWMDDDGLKLSDHGI